MRRKFSKQTQLVLDVIAGIAIVALMALVIWMDVAKGWWAETVILSGIAAGILTFFLTALLIERWMARREHRQWYPVTRLALTDILHALADDEKSDIRRAHIVPRSLHAPEELTHEHLDRLLHRIVRERDEVSQSLARWAQFLASSADVQGLMNQIADLAENLDDMRDCVVELEAATPGTAEWDETELHANLKKYNEGNDKIIEEILAIQKKLEVYEL